MSKHKYGNLREFVDFQIGEAERLYAKELELLELQMFYGDSEGHKIFNSIYMKTRRQVARAHNMFVRFRSVYKSLGMKRLESDYAKGFREALAWVLKQDHGHGHVFAAEEEGTIEYTQEGDEVSTKGDGNISTTLGESEDINLTFE